METLTIDMARFSSGVIYFSLATFLFYVVYWLLRRKRELESQRLWEERRCRAVLESRKQTADLVRSALVDLENDPENKRSGLLLGGICTALGSDPLGERIFSLLKCWRRTPQSLSERISDVRTFVSRWEEVELRSL